LMPLIKERKTLSSAVILACRRRLTGGTCMGGSVETKYTEGLIGRR